VGKEAGRSGERDTLHDLERGEREGGGVEDVEHLGSTVEKVDGEVAEISNYVRARPWQQAHCYPPSSACTRLCAQRLPCCILALTHCPDKLHDKQRSAGVPTSIFTTCLRKCVNEVNLLAKERGDSMQGKLDNQTHSFDSQAQVIQTTKQLEIGLVKLGPY